MKSNNPTTKTIQIPLTYNEDGSIATFEEKEVTFDSIKPTVILDGNNLIVKLIQTNADGCIGDTTTYISNLIEDEYLNALNTSIQDLIQNFINKKGL